MAALTVMGVLLATSSDSTRSPTRQATVAAIDGGAGLRAALQANGDEFALPTAADQASVALSPDEALATAIKDEGPAPATDHHVYLGRLTNLSQTGTGATSRKSPESNRLAYVVQFTRLHLPPLSIKPGTRLRQVHYNHELNVFIDPKTGDEIMASSFR